ncbi:MAG: aminoacyl-tRNA hydrolase [Patescibacteria group bacterium]|jgi:PTH1 family peptidyl-tRNA hydrolase
MTKLITGLGNPGEKYANTRHNVGFLFLDYISRKSKVESKKESGKFQSEIIEIEFEGKKLVLLKPQTFMNESGKAVSSYIRYSNFDIRDLLVVHDDLDLKLGEYKINLGKGPKVHNGVNSVEELLGTKDFWRVRIGVDNRNSENRIPGEAYVLQNFTEEERKVLATVFEKAFSELKID